MQGCLDGSQLQIIRVLLYASAQYRALPAQRQNDGDELDDRC